VRFVERGYTRTNGKVMAAQPWLEPAFDSKIREGIDKFSAKMTEAIDREMRKIGAI
jgi:hypothetical protein